MTGYNIIRRIHFLASIIIMVFCLFYLFTGFILSKYDWFCTSMGTTTEKTFLLETTVDTSDYATAFLDIREKYSIRGRTDRLQIRNDGKIVQRTGRPGLYWEIRIHPKHDSVTLRRNEQQTFGRIAANFHRLKGYRGDWKYIAWAVCYDLAAVSFILFALTGIIIWARNSNVLKKGWFIIIPVLILTVFIYCILSR